MARTIRKRPTQPRGNGSEAPYGTKGSNWRKLAAQRLERREHEQEIRAHLTTKKGN